MKPAFNTHIKQIQLVLFLCLVNEKSMRKVHLYNCDIIAISPILHAEF